MPAYPAYLESLDDPWFAPPVYSEKQITVKEAYEHAVTDNQILEESETSEPSDIHERIYQIATALEHCQSIEKVVLKIFRKDLVVGFLVTVGDIYK